MLDTKTCKILNRAVKINVKIRIALLEDVENPRFESNIPAKCRN